MMRSSVKWLNWTTRNVQASSPLASPSQDFQVNDNGEYPTGNGNGNGDL
jgi:hypothetical protein